MGMPVHAQARPCFSALTNASTSDSSAFVFVTTSYRQAASRTALWYARKSLCHGRLRTACYRTVRDDSLDLGSREYSDSQATDGDSPDLPVRYELRVRCPQTTDTDVVSVVGGAPELGGWNVGKGARLVRRDDGQYHVDLLLNAENRRSCLLLEYKFVLKRASGQILVEDGKRRLLPRDVQPGGRERIEVSAKWSLADKRYTRHVRSKMRSPTPQPSNTGVFHALRNALSALPGLGRRNGSRSPSPLPASRASDQSSGPTLPAHVITPPALHNGNGHNGTHARPGTTQLRLKSPSPKRVLRLSPSPARASQSSSSLTSTSTAATYTQTDSSTGSSAHPSWQHSSPPIGVTVSDSVELEDVSVSDTAKGDVEISPLPALIESTRLLRDDVKAHGPVAQEGPYGTGIQSASRASPETDSSSGSTSGEGEVLRTGVVESAPAIPLSPVVTDARRNAAPPAMALDACTPSCTRRPASSAAASISDIYHEEGEGDRANQMLQVHTPTSSMTDTNLTSAIVYTADAPVAPKAVSFAEIDRHCEQIKATDSDRHAEGLVDDAAGIFAVAPPALDDEVSLIVMVPHYEASPDCQLVLCGDSPAFGSWKPERALPLVACDHGGWMASVRHPLIDLLVGVEAKLVCVHNHRQGSDEARGGSERAFVKDADWEPCDNRLLRIEAGHYSKDKSYMVTLNWAQPTSTVTPTPAAGTAVSVTVRVSGKILGLPSVEDGDGNDDMSASSSGVAPTRRGKLVLVGDDPLLGGWDVTKGVILAQQARPQQKRSMRRSDRLPDADAIAPRGPFEGVVELPLGRMTKSKLVWIDDNRGCTPVWETGHNRKLLGTPGCTEMRLKWRAPSRAKAAAAAPSASTKSTTGLPVSPQESSCLPLVQTVASPAALTNSNNVVESRTSSSSSVRIDVEMPSHDVIDTLTSDTRSNRMSPSPLPTRPNLTAHEVLTGSPSPEVSNGSPSPLAVEDRPPVSAITDGRRWTPYSRRSRSSGSSKSASPPPAPFKVDLNAAEALRAARYAAFALPAYSPEATASVSATSKALPLNTSCNSENLDLEGVHYAVSTTTTASSSGDSDGDGDSKEESPAAPSRAAGVATLVQFVVPQLDIQLGQSLRLVGSEPELGNWDPEHGLTLDMCEGGMWVAAAWLPAGSIVHAKLVLVSQIEPQVQTLPDGRVLASFRINASSIAVNSSQLMEMSSSEAHSPVYIWEDGANRTFHVVGRHRNLVVCHWSDTRCCMSALDIVRCEFVVRSKVVPAGHWLAVVGSDPVADNERPRHAVILRWQYGNTWVGHVDLPRHVAVLGFAARLMMCSYDDKERTNLRVDKEEGPMRLIKALDPHAVVIRAVMNWGDSAETQLYAVATQIPLPSPDLAPPALVVQAPALPTSTTPAVTVRNNVSTFACKAATPVQPTASAVQQSSSYVMPGKAVDVVAAAGGASSPGGASHTMLRDSERSVTAHSYADTRIPADNVAAHDATTAYSSSTARVDVLSKAVASVAQPRRQPRGSGRRPSTHLPGAYPAPRHRQTRVLVPQRRVAAHSQYFDGLTAAATLPEAAPAAPQSAGFIGDAGRL